VSDSDSGSDSEQTRKRGLWDTFRKRIAPLAFLAALVLLATRTCSTELARVEVALDFGAAAERVRQVRVDVFPRGDDRSVLFFERTYGERGVTSPPSFEAQLDAGAYELLFEVVLDDGMRRFARVVEVTDQATITVKLERDLR
jgi:hypothetical protein